MKVKDLKVALRAFGITPKGNKGDMIKLLEEARLDQDYDHRIRKNATQAEIEAGIQCLEEKGYKIFNVDDDGACFFRCLALHYEGDEERHDKYRTEVADKLANYKEIIGEFLERKDGESVDDTVTRMATAMRATDEWVGEDGIFLSAMVLEVDIVVHDVTRAEPTRYSIGTCVPLIYKNPTIEVFYDGKHYRYLRPSVGESKPEFPVRALYGDYRDKATQDRFDADLCRWGRHSAKHKVAAAAWEKREMGGGLGTDPGTSAAPMETTSDPALTPAPPPAPPPAPASSSHHADKLWRKRATGRLSSFYVPVQEIAEAQDAVSVAHKAAAAAEAASEAAQIASKDSAENPADEILRMRAETTRLRADKAVKDAEAAQQILQNLRTKMDVGIRVNPDLAEAVLGKPKDVIDPEPWEFSVRRDLDGSEKGCLLLSGAQELFPGSPSHLLTPLKEEDNFKAGSALSSFWNLMMDSKGLPASSFYFVRKSGPTCDGVMLLRKMSRSRVGSDTKITIEILRCCASGAAGNGALLVFHLCSLLYLLEQDTELRVDLRGCKESSRGFWTKVGFTAPGETPAPNEGRAKRAKNTLADALTLNVKGRETWEAYLKSKHPSMIISDDIVGQATTLDDGLIVSHWSQAHLDRWYLQDPEVAEFAQESKRGPPKSEDELLAAIQESKAFIGQIPVELIGTRVTVKGNGSCWLYAVMAGYGGILDHANPCVITRKTQPERMPTKQDYAVSKSLMSAMKAHVEKDETLVRLHKSSQDHLKKEISALKVATPTEAGTYGGGENTYSVLAHLLQVSIVFLDLSTPKQFWIYHGNDKFGKERCQTSDLEGRLRSLKEEHQYVVVESNGIRGRGGHFAGYLPAYDRHFSVHSCLAKHFPGLTWIANLR